jgi:hypothetical protein
MKLLKAIFAGIMATVKLEPALSEMKLLDNAHLLMPNYDYMEEHNATS